jgi:hypothetical protein
MTSRDDVNEGVRYPVPFPSSIRGASATGCGAVHVPRNFAAARQFAGADAFSAMARPKQGLDHAPPNPISRTIAFTAHLAD